MKKPTITLYLIIISLTLLSFFISFTQTRDILTKENFFGPILLIFLIPFYYFFFVLLRACINLFNKTNISKRVRGTIIYFIVILLLLNIAQIRGMVVSTIIYHQMIKPSDLFISIVPFLLLCFTFYYTLYNKNSKLFFEQLEQK